MAAHRLLRSAICAIALGLPLGASAALQISDYLEMALSGADAKGELGGPMAANISAATRSDSPVQVHVRVARWLPELPDCGRVLITVSQRVPTTDGRKAQWEQELEMSMCKGLDFPEQGPDLQRKPPVVRLMP